MFDLSDLTPDKIGDLSNAELGEIAAKVLKLQQDDTRENQLLYYRPAHEACKQVHESTAKVVGVGEETVLPRRRLSLPT